jgi:hypothetical protein
VAVALLGALPPSAASAAEDPAPPSLSVDAATAVLTGPDDAFSATVTVENRASSPVTGSVVLRVARAPFESAEALADWPGKPVTGAEADAWNVREEPGIRLDPGERRTVTLKATAADMRLGTLEAEPGWGPRGLAVTWETASRGARAQVRTYVVYAPPAEVKGSVRLGATAGLTVAPGETRETALARLQRVTRETAEPWVDWILDPALLTAAENEDQSAVERLAQAVVGAIDSGKTVRSLPYQDLDEAMMAAAGEPYRAAVRACRTLGDSRLREALGAEVAARVQDDVSWAARPLEQSKARAIGAAGAQAVILSSEQFANAPEAAVYRVEDGPLVAVADATLAAAALSDPGVLGASRVLADSAFAAVKAQVSGSRAVLMMSLPRGWDPAAGGVKTLRLLAEAPWVQPTALAALLNEPDGGAIQLTASTAPPGPDAQDLGSLLERIGNDVAFASLTQEPVAYLARALPPLLVPLSNSSRTGASRTTAARTALANAATSLAPVQVVAGSEVNLISDGGMVPVVVENQSNVPVSGLVVKLTAQTHAIRVEDPVVLDLNPGQSVTARVPVHAVANGVFDVRVDLLDASGGAVTRPASMTMRVRAEWENVGTAIIGGVLALVLVLGVISTVRKRRAAKRAPALNGAAAGGHAGGERAAGDGSADSPTGAQLAATLGADTPAHAAAQGEGRARVGGRHRPKAERRPPG